MTLKMKGLWIFMLAALLAAGFAIPAKRPAQAMEGHDHIMVSVDIKPGSFPNAINIRSKGNVPVALFGGADFDVSMVDLSTVKLHPMDKPDLGAPVLKYAFEDVNGDGFMDILFHFKTQLIGLTTADTEACLHGNLLDGQHFCGHDSVKVID